jgi:hypothetical protein
VQGFYIFLSPDGVCCNSVQIGRKQAYVFCGYALVSERLGYVMSLHVRYVTHQMVMKNEVAGITVPLSYFNTFRS